MEKVERDLIRETESILNIRFIRPRSDLLAQLNEQLEILSENFRVPTYRPQVPERGFLDMRLSAEQDKRINQLIGPLYATSAVELQEKLTVIPIKENLERMVHLPPLFYENNVSLSLSNIPFQDACGQWAKKQRIFWARENVATRILKAGQALEILGIIIHLEDAFRPVGVQEGLFFRRVKMILQQHPAWIHDWDKVWTEARSKTALCPCMAGHKSGAALDITLHQKSDGLPLPIGNIYPEGGPKVALCYPYVTQEEWSNRQLFALTMEMAGLKTYPYENWHASFNDLSAGIVSFSLNEVTPNYTAVYGPIKDFDVRTGKIQPYTMEEYFKPFFTKEEVLESLKAETR